MDRGHNANAPPQERFFDWTIERKELAPDGIPRLMYTINGAFPGPIIQANEGDTVSVRVKNAIFDDYTLPKPPMSSQMGRVMPNGTETQVAFHWHGLSMRGSQIMDGAPGFTSFAISRGEEHLYRFRIHKEDVGTHWYHSHAGASRADGLWGMLIVHAREYEPKLLQRIAQNASVPLHWDEEVAVAVGDHFHELGPVFFSYYISRWLQKAEPVPASGLINGRSRFSCEHSRLTQVPCPADPLGAESVGEYTIFTLQQDRRYRLRIANVGSLADETFSVDGHTLTVIEADGTLVQPITVHRLPIAPGQRYSVLLNRVNSVDRAWMRAEMSAECFQYMNPVMNLVTKAIIAYQSVPSARDTVGGWLSPLRRGVQGRDAMALHVARNQETRRSVDAVLLPQSSAWSPNVTDAPIPIEPCHDLEPGALVPLVPDPAPELHLAHGDVRETVYVTVPALEKWHIVPMAYMNQSTWRSNAAGHQRAPLLHRIAHANTTDPAEWRAQDVVFEEHELVVSPHPSKPVVFELVINNQDDSPHPFHLHGHKFWVMETDEVDPAFGGYNLYEDVGQVYDLQRTMKRDTVLVPTLGHAVIRWKADNPGVWAFHCHMLVHLLSGMAMAIAEQPALLQAAPPVPPMYR
ncbi:L-ascorbate oxidase [Malassezia vespertilionis]|uniref:laccase n=1 Tax=Malassezia vespertilionis TaxID=2020962 RepID=A0A2N1J7J8_9BASI|nr:L-ascorbate oxidase [Malassezia vespertilionis]PKI82514.1 hypothetical protein MVES_003561 [Malassezia vespertilionis]WFD08635.1 L-ascorbate oxidase [Malassezia vespertilionis]